MDDACPPLTRNLANRGSPPLRAYCVGISELTSAPVPGLRPDDHVRGPEDAPLLFVYADFTCPYCAVAHERLKDAPVRVAFRHFALKAKHPRAVPLAVAAEAAAAQRAFWPFHDLLYADQGRIDDPHLWERVRALGLDLDRFERDRRADDGAERVRRDTREALRGGATATPTTVVAGELLSGPPTEEWLAARLAPRRA